jgi:Right handed beta helix region
MKTKIFLLFILPIIGYSQNKYYVATNGNNDNNGSITQPWQTFQKACSAAMAGDSIFFRQGRYSGIANIQNSGNAINWIVFTNYQSENVQIEGNNIVAQTILGIYNIAYIKIIGLHITNSTSNNSRGLFIGGTSNNIQILNCKFSNIHFSANPNDAVNSGTNVNPLKVCGDNANIPIQNILLDGNEVSNCRTGYSEGIAVSGNVDGFMVSNNYVHDLFNIGIVLAGHYTSCSDKQARNGIVRDNFAYNCQFGLIEHPAAGIYIDGAKDIIIEKNRVGKCQVGIQIGCENFGKTATNNIVRNNWVYFNVREGLGIGSSIGGGQVLNSSIINNTTYKNGTYTDNNGGYDGGELYITNVDGITVSNNIFYARTHFYTILMKIQDITKITTSIIDNNLYFPNDNTPNVRVKFGGASEMLKTFQEYKTITSKDLNSKFDNPLFIDISDEQNPELHLKPASAAINNGLLLGDGRNGTTDFDGNNRLESSSIDIGAYEYKNCPDNYKVFGTLGTDNITKFETSNKIEANNVVKTLNNINYDAGKSILLKTGFQTESGSVFKAYINGCAND